MAQQQGSYNQYGQYGQIPGQAAGERFPRFYQGNAPNGASPGQYPAGTFQTPNIGGGTSGSTPTTTGTGTNTSDLSTTPPTGSPGAPTGTTPTTSTPAPQPSSAGAAGQQPPDSGTTSASPSPSTASPSAGAGSQYPAGTFPGLTPLYGGSLGSNSTGPVNMALGAAGAPGAWDGGYNAFNPPPQQTTPLPPTPPAAGGAAPAAVPPAGPSTSTPWQAPATDPSFHGDPVYSAATIAKARADAAAGKNDYSLVIPGHIAPWLQVAPAGAPTGADFTANNPGYGATGYLGNDAQVASQVANHAQASSIPTGVLGQSFYQGGADYGGQQNTGNSMSGNNGATNWNDPTVSGYGVDRAAIENALRQKMLSQAFAAQGLSYPAGTFR